jgi:hypothetical protein
VKFPKKPSFILSSMFLSGFHLIAHSAPDLDGVYSALNRFLTEQAGGAIKNVKQHFIAIEEFGKLACVPRDAFYLECSPTQKDHPINFIVIDSSLFTNLDGNTIALRANIWLKEAEQRSPSELRDIYFPTWGTYLIWPPVHILIDPNSFQFKSPKIKWISHIDFVVTTSSNGSSVVKSMYASVCRPKKAGK